MVADHLLQTLLTSPNTILIGGTTLAIAIILLDMETGISLSLPGRRRFGLAATVFIGAAVWHYFQRFGVQGLLDQISGNIVSAFIVAVVVGYILRYR